MISFHFHKLDNELAELVRMSFVRSFTQSQVCCNNAESPDACVHVFINPVKSDYELLLKFTGAPSKIIILGKIPTNIAELLGLEVENLPADSHLWDQCDAAPVYGFSESTAKIVYKNLPGAIDNHISNRPLLRYDFAEEWNNLGYGHVRTDGSVWSLACKAKLISSSSAKLASVCHGDEELTVFATLSAHDESEIMWVNRPVGFVDSHEFRLFETFITNYKSETLPCLPLIREIPYGYDAMISMRLDCDEDIATSRHLFELYKSLNVPFSLALRTGQPIKEEDVILINEVIDNGGAILSHSVNHKCNWENSFDEVKREAENSRDDILCWTDKIHNIEYAVSPFHQNPDYAVQALDASGYKGFIGGIICNDPQYLISSGGKVSAVLEIISHSQQCMLHGDCMLNDVNDSLAVYKECAKYTINSGAAFGYLDHPFSERYQYGWLSEEQRVSVHNDLIKFLKSFGNVLFVNENCLLDHIQKKSQAEIWVNKGVVKSKVENNDINYSLSYEFKGTFHPVLE